MKFKKSVFIISSFALCLALANVAVIKTQAASSAQMDANIFVGLSKKIVPSVVNISTLSTIKTPYMHGGSPDDLFRQFFDEFFRRHGGRGDDGSGEEDEEMPPSQPRKQQALSLGTGFIIDSSGLILTNNHVVAGADEIKINFTEETEEKPTDGEVVGRDPELDVALIKVKTKRELVSVALGDSDALEVGEYVIAVGNPFGQGHSVTHGIISAKGRLSPDFPLATYIQTDAPINPGNSGGPLVNLKGEVIGINNAIDQRAQGIGFAIPISSVKKILPQLKTKGAVARGYIGVVVQPLVPEVASKIGAPKDMHAPFVNQVIASGPSEKAGIEPYDVILSFGGKAIHTPDDLIRSVTQMNVGDSVPVKILRNGSEQTVTIKISQRPNVPQAFKSENGHGKKKEKKPSRIDTGMELEDLTPETARELGMPEKSKGAVVSAINFGSPADRAGMMRGDVIVEVDRKPVKDINSFYAAVKEKKSYLLRVRRGDPRGGETYSVIILDLKD